MPSIKSTLHLEVPGSLARLTSSKNAKKVIFERKIDLKANRYERKQLLKM